MKFKTLLCLCFRMWLLVKTLTGGQRLKHRWERLPKTHEIFSRGICCIFMVALLSYVEKKALHHCANYLTVI